MTPWKDKCARCQNTYERVSTRDRGLCFDCRKTERYKKNAAAKAALRGPIVIIRDPLTTQSGDSAGFPPGMYIDTFTASQMRKQKSFTPGTLLESRGKTYRVNKAGELKPTRIGDHQQKRAKAQRKRTK